MQVPEKLTLIGGGILLSSLLVFTLKSQASNLLPKVNKGVSAVFDDKADQSHNGSSNQPSQQQAQQQAEQAFNSNYQQAQQKNWQTGQWGSAKFYVDDQNDMHVGGGQLQGSYTNVADINKIKTISLAGSVRAPQDSHDLFATTGETVSALQHINHLDYLNTSQVTGMSDMFYDDSSLSNVDLSHFDTHNVTSMMAMFYGDTSLSSLDMSHFDTHNVTNMEEMFAGDNNIHQLDLGSNTKLSNNGEYGADLDGNYQSNGQTLNPDGNAHPGTWMRQ